MMQTTRVFIPLLKKQENFSYLISLYKRTQGISTTEIVDKIMHIEDPDYKKSNLVENIDKKYYHTINKFRLFLRDRPFASYGKVVFCCGSFDLLNFAHVAFLEKAKAEGDYLIVGLYDDSTINELKGFNYPVLDVHSRALNLLSLRFVDDVILNSPYKLTPDFISEFNIDVIVEGKTSYMKCIDPKVDSFELIRGLTNIIEIDSGIEFGFDDLIARIKDNKQLYAEVLEIKKAKLIKYYQTRTERSVAEIV